MDAQGSQTGAKQDTRLLLLASVTTDLSQYSTDLSSSGAGGYESPSVRTGLTGARELYVRWTATKSEASAALLYHGRTDLADYTYLVATTAGGFVRLYQNGATLWTSAIDVSAAEYSIAWSTRTNPDSTGASDAMISEVIVYDHDGAAIWERAEFEHAAATTDASWSFSVAGIYNGGGLSFPPTNAPSKTRVSHTHHPDVEYFEDWIAARPSHSAEVVEIAEPVGVGLPVAGVGQWAGQGNVGLAAAHAYGLRGRVLCPLVNEVRSQARTLTTAGEPDEWLVQPPGGSSVYKIDVTSLRWCRVPEGVTHVLARVHVQSWVAAGAAVAVGVRVVAMNRPHIGLGVQLAGQPIPPLQATFAEATLEVDHGDPDEGEWLELGALQLPTFTGPVPGWTGTVTLGLAHAFDPAASSGNDANARLRIWGWQVRPLVGVPS